MADALQVHVYPKASNPIWSALVHLSFWTPLVAAVLLTDHWVINTLALIVGPFWFYVTLTMFSGKYVGLSKAQAIKWVGDGAPSDVKTWKQESK